MTSQATPDPKTFTRAPLRHRLRLELNRPPPDVWALVGDHRRLPEYSGGIATVDLASSVRTCRFRAGDGSATGPELREQIRWELPGVGYATSAEPGNAFGLRDSLSLVTIRPHGNGSLFTWEEYYDSDDLAAARASYVDGFNDMAQRLVARFGGRTVEAFTDAP